MVTIKIENDSHELIRYGCADIPDDTWTLSTNFLKIK